MPPEPAPVQPGYGLTLADGSRYTIRAADAAAGRVVEAFAAAAGLPAAGGRQPGRTVLVVSAERSLAGASLADDPAVPLLCPVLPSTDPDMLAIGMTGVMLAVAHDVQRRGGLLLHGALAEWPAGDARWGVLFAAPGSTGKSTASRRLPPPWRVLCDDTTLLVRDGRGRYRAHPVPTWSRFYSYTGARGGVWDMQTSVPLRAVFFLSQSPDDGVEPLASRTCAMALLAESAEQVGQWLRRHLPPDEAERLNQERLANVAALAHAMPAWRLHLSLNGAFWNPVERVLAGLSRLPDGQPEISCQAPPTPNATAPDAAFIVYTGPSMNPTLAEPDILEVMPYVDGQPRVGDVIYFAPATTGRGIVHRVVAITPQGLRTRGDHNPTADVDPVQPSEVVGRVVAAHRGTRRRVVAGGWPGAVDRLAARISNRFARLSARLAGRLYRVLAPAVAGRLPARLRPRVVRFTARHRDYDRLLLGRRVIGQYDLRRRDWMIRFPYRLLVDAAQLPQPAEPRITDRP